MSETSGLLEIPDSLNNAHHGFKRKAWTLCSKDQLRLTHSKTPKVWTTWTRPISHHLDFLGTYGECMMDSDSDDDDNDKKVKEECNCKVLMKVQRIKKIQDLLTPPPVIFPHDAIVLTSSGTPHMTSSSSSSTSETTIETECAT